MSKLTNLPEPQKAGRMRRLVLGLLRWPQHPNHTVRRYWSPWWVIAWRAVWIGPTWTLAAALVLVVAIGWGKRKAEILYHDLL
jgi:hypothetical protein